MASEETDPAVVTEPVEEPVAGRVLIVKTESEGTLRVTLPPDARVTFGAFVPSKEGKYGGPYSPTTALRIYHGANKDHQIAVFRNVVSFRDESLKVQKLVRDEKAKGSVVHGKGKLTVQNEEEVAEKWIDF